MLLVILATSKTLKFPVLTHTNYPEWATRMEAVLVWMDYWALVTSNENLEEDEDDGKILRVFRKRQAACRAEMVLRVDDSQLSRMSNRDPKVVWDSVHRACGFSSRLQLRHHFISAVTIKDQTMEGRIREVHSRTRRLENIDIAISDKDLVVVLTAGLPDTYSTVVITHLLNEEARQRLSDQTEIKKEEYVV